MTYKSVVPLLDAAQRLEVPGLPAACRMFLAQVLAPSTVCELLGAALAAKLSD